MNPIAAHKGAARPPRAKRKDYVAAFADIVAQFISKDSSKVLPLVPECLVSDFASLRSELWLWDAASSSARLACSAGIEAGRQRKNALLSDGPIGKVAQTRKALENVALSSLSDSEKEFASRAGLRNVSAYPLIVRGELIGVLANYTKQPADPEVLGWWLLYAEVCSVTVHGALDESESRKTITQLSLLFEATRLLNSTLDLAELLELILKIARTELKADRGSVFLADHKSQELWSIVASGLDHEEIRVPIGRGVAGMAAASGDIINVEDAYSLPYFDSSYDKKFGYTTRSLLCLPIRHFDGEIVGVIQLLNKNGASRFTNDDVDFLNKLSGHMAMALEKARLHREIVEKQRLEKEMALARTIQRSLLPEAPPVVPGYELAVLNEPCFEVGGDYYDFLNLGPQTLLLVIADVEGKGVSSALIMSNLQATLRALVMHLHSLEVLALSLNEMIYNDTKSEKFLSIFLGLVDTRRSGLHYINAGHVPPILINGETGKYKLLEEGGTVIGLFPTAEYNRGSASLMPGDVLVCCTDGILEAMNAQEDEYGNDRLAECVASHRTKPAQAIVDAVLAEVSEFSRSGTHMDDKVLMIMKVTQAGAVETAKAG
ncbi:MAG TPA: GAF domain-containing SpoIIE family protein phosphatase [Terriglobales bacterium]|nr:GAF domain-containing SpoIIE family protein phosphatase [Terriglobales bacterium]